MEDRQPGIRQRIDDFFTDYLRKTTTDQEILDFYGEGNIVGRKGIPEDVGSLLKSVEDSNRIKSARPISDRPNIKVGGIDQEVGYDYSTRDIPGVISPETGRSWQMTFGTLPKDFGSGSFTPAAKQFLEDFRVPQRAGFDYSFATGPNIQDRIEFETKQQIENDPYWGRQPEKLQEKLDAIKNKSSHIGDYGGQPMTPKTWQDLGYIKEKPPGLKTNVLDEFKNRIFETQGPFGGTSTLTPVEQQSAGNPNWRAELYEQTGLAGPVSEQSFASGYGGGSKDVQRFTTGTKRLLPLQPYSEFLKGVGDTTRPSALATSPAPDFTPFQKAIGTRNYLIGRNVLQGRGSLGRGLTGAASVGVADFIPSPEAIQSFYKGDPAKGVRQMATDFVSGIPVAAGAGTVAGLVPGAAAVMPGVGLGLTGVAAGQAANEVVRQQTGEGIVPKFRQFIGTSPRTGVSSAQRTTPFVTPQVKPLTSAQRKEMSRQSNRNELQRRIDLFRERFNPSKGEFGLSEVLFGR